MSHQLTFVDSEFNGKRRKTRKELFLARMDALLPWSMIVSIIDPVYPKVGSWRPPYQLDTMLRIHCMQQWYNLSTDGTATAFGGDSERSGQEEIGTLHRNLLLILCSEESDAQY